MPVMRRLPGDPLSEVAGLMGPLGLPAAVGGVLGKATKLTPDDLMALNDLLGKPIRIGKRLLRLSSGDPAANKAIIHAATGERFSSPLDEFLNLWRTAGEDTAEAFPEGAVVSAPGIKAPEAAIGPKGGLGPIKRRLGGR